MPIFDSDNETVIWGEEEGDLEGALFANRRRELCGEADLRIGKIIAV